MRAEGKFARKWAKRIGMALLLGVLASLVYHATAFVQVGLSSKLLGNAYHFAFRLALSHAFRDGRLLHTPQRFYTLVLIVNVLLYAVFVLVLAAWKDLLIKARSASPDNGSRTLVTFCFVQTLGVCFLLLEIDPGTVIGMILLLPGIILAVWMQGGALRGIFVSLCVNALVWFAYSRLSNLEAWNEKP